MALVSSSMVLYIAKILYLLDNWFGNCQGDKILHRHTHTLTHTKARFISLVFLQKCGNKTKLTCLQKQNTELPKNDAQLQMAVTRGLGLSAGRLAGHHTDAAPKHLLCHFSSVSVQMVTHINVHLQMETLEFGDCYYCQTLLL